MTDGPRLASLRKKLKAREGKKEYEESCKDLRVEIIRLERIAAGPEFDL